MGEENEAYLQVRLSILRGDRGRADDDFLRARVVCDCDTLQQSRKDGVLFISFF